MQKHRTLWPGSISATIRYVMNKRAKHRIAPAHLARCGLLGVIMLLLAACGGSDSSATAVATPQAVRVNGFGTAANHPHAFIAFSDNVLVLATHYGTFWSGNGGTNWTEVAGGPGQLMDGLMTYSLTSSPLDEQRLYELTQPAVNNHKGILGLYTSTDQGHSWQLSIPADNLAPDRNIYLAAAGNDTPEEVYVYLPALGAAGLRVSKGSILVQPARCPLGM